MAQKHIDMHLEDGDLKGIIWCTLSGWVGRVYRIPRERLADIGRNADLSRSGVYCLIGDKGERPHAYVGQGSKRKDESGILRRVAQHDNAREAYWDTVLVFIAKDKDLSNTEICYLEHHFYKLARETGRYVVENSVEPPDGTPGPGLVCDLECYIDGAKLVMEALGCKLFVPQEQPAPTPVPPEPTPTPVPPNPPNPPMPQPPTPVDGTPFTLARTVGRKWKVSGQGMALSDGHFIVLKGSILAPLQASKPCLTSGQHALRERYCLPQDTCELRENVEFTSLSGAASFIIGNSVNGKEYWHEQSAPEHVEYTFVCRTRKGPPVTATLREHADGRYELLEGSGITMPLEGKASLSDSLRRLRHEVSLDENGKLLQPLVFTSSSTAASFVSGGSTNGNIAWKRDGKTMGELKKQG